ncbi:MAG: SCO family protein [Candidatus Binatia bacterium]
MEQIAIGAAILPVLPALAAATVPPCAKTSGGPRASYFPNVVLLDQDNAKARFYDDLIRGKTVLINFFYTTCQGSCPLTTANLLRVQTLLGDQLGRGVHMYSITLDPAHDTPAVLRQYARSHHIGAGWRLLTGAPADIETLRRKLGFVSPDPEEDKRRSSHLGVLRYGNEAVDRWAACPSTANPAEIVKYVSWLDPGTLRHDNGHAWSAPASLRSAQSPGAAPADTRRGKVE